MTAARPTLTAATFTHAPHVNTLRQACESCHETTERSGRAAELNLPHVNRCQSCHGVTPGASTSCMSCHVYTSTSECSAACVDSGWKFLI